MSTLPIGLDGSDHRQAKFGYGGSILSSNQFHLLPQLTKNEARFKSCQILHKNSHLAVFTVKLTVAFKLFNF
jgi:hypothetical protein